MGGPMKENVLDVLMYLFENYMDDGPEFNPDQETLTHELTEAGFPRGEIRKAFHWLEGLSLLREQSSVQSHGGSARALRYYSRAEQEKLSAECRGFLLSMEQSGVLNPRARELVIERVMALDVEEISLDQLKWVMLMVLFNQPGQENAYDFLEDMVFDEVVPGRPH
jgi:Smg protein